MPYRLFLAVLVFASLAAPAPAGEICLRAQARCAGAVVTLGDVAELRLADPAEAARLAAVELVPAPAPGQTRHMRLRELQDLLLGRGVGLREHRFTGAAAVVVAAPAPAAAIAPVPAAGESIVLRAQRRIRAAVEARLREAGAAGAVVGEFDLTDVQARLAGQAVRSIAVAGGQAPWTGTQPFEVHVERAEGTVTFPLAVNLAARAQVVVCTRALARGDLVGPGDVALQHAPEGISAGDGFPTIEEVLDAEATRPIASGSVLQPGDVRPRLLVRPGQVVTVRSRSAGVRVRTVARAKAEGSLGQVIEVESIENRTRYFAQVSGTQEVEVVGRTVIAAGTGPVAQEEGGTSPSAARGVGR